MFDTDLPLHLIFAAMAAAAFLKGITGLGFSTICLGLLASVVELKVAIPLVILPSLSSNVIVMVQAGKFRPTLARFRWMYLAAIPGLVAGIWFLETTANQELSAALGVVLVAYAVFALLNPEFRMSSAMERWLAAPVGLLTGLINGATGSQVMPALPYLMSLGLDRDSLVQSINISFTLGSIVMLAGLAHLGLLNVAMLGYALAGVLVVWLGISAGGWIRSKLPEKWFRLAVLAMLIGLGTNLARGTFA